jgi:hypothetical protein
VLRLLILADLTLLEQEAQMHEKPLIILLLPLIVCTALGGYLGALAAKSLNENERSEEMRQVNRDVWGGLCLFLGFIIGIGLVAAVGA